MNYNAYRTFAIAFVIGFMTVAGILIANTPPKAEAPPAPSGEPSPARSEDKGDGFYSEVVNGIRITWLHDAGAVCFQPLDIVNSSRPAITCLPMDEYGRAK